MSTCTLCQSRKAKRHCPALDRGICSICCAKQRLVDIECPEDCRYLEQRRRVRSDSFTEMDALPFNQMLLLDQFSAHQYLLQPFLVLVLDAMHALFKRDAFFTDAMILNVLDYLIDVRHVESLGDDEMEMNRGSVLSFTIRDLVRSYRIEHPNLSAMQVRAVLAVMKFNIIRLRWQEADKDERLFIRYALKQHKDEVAQPPKAEDELLLMRQFLNGVK
ncbi:hypothetical protein JW905_19445 [bacterium]|nr:hypothetical protein [candidate division CSSED10-310 bacterium]